MPKIYRLNRVRLEYQVFELVKQSPKYVIVILDDGTHKRLAKWDSNFPIFYTKEDFFEYLKWAIECRILLCEQNILVALGEKEEFELKLKNLQNATNKD